MTRSYKGYKIETVTRVELGEWEAWAKITPVSPIARMGNLSLSKRGATREAAESAVWDEAKKRIDEAPEQPIRT